ncbi:hypothetical protein BDZ45DRAFT_676589 [Acephala macrosclerotiorum]|nr:hypothetical protein BDZ45DRAFT_676589 [Acephala macrosclerotiorum]
MTILSLRATQRHVCDGELDSGRTDSYLSPKARRKSTEMFSFLVSSSLFVLGKVVEERQFVSLIRPWELVLKPKPELEVGLRQSYGYQPSSVKGTGTFGKLRCNCLLILYDANSILPRESQVVEVSPRSQGRTCSFADGISAATTDISTEKSQYVVP